jgi:hypothetical protein
MQSPFAGTMGAMQSTPEPTRLTVAHVTLATPSRGGSPRPGVDVAAEAVLASRRASSGSPTVARAPARSLAHQLERDRIERRAVRVRQVIHALRERADARDNVGGAPRPLRAAIEDFGRELAELERRLRHHSPAPGSGG